MAKKSAVHIQAIKGWILIAHDSDYGWNIAWHDVFRSRKTAIEFAVNNKWPQPYRAVRGQLCADQSR